MALQILVIFAHPAIRRSRVNRALVRAARGLEGVTVHDLYETYPDFSIDVPREQALLSGHDVIVFQHPFYWYSAPSILKEWMDLVLEYGFAYGEDGRALAGKGWMNAISTGGQETQYGPDTPNLFFVEDLLRPFEATANLCRMHWISPFLVQGTHGLTEGEIAAAAQSYRARLLTLAAEVAPIPRRSA